MGAEAVEIVLEFLTVERVDRQQFLDAVDDCHGIGAGLVLVGLDRLSRIADLYQIGRLLRQPALDTEAAQALGDELQLPLLAVHLVHLDGGADLGEMIVAELVDRGVADEGNAQGVVGRVADPAHGLFPAFAVDHQRLDLGRKERAVVDRQQIDTLGQVVARRHHGVVGDLVHFTVGPQRLVGFPSRLPAVLVLIVFAHEDLILKLLKPDCSLPCGMRAA